MNFHILAQWSSMQLTGAQECYSAKLNEVHWSSMTLNCLCSLTARALRGAQWSWMTSSLNEAQWKYSSIQLNTAQCILKNHWIRLCFAQCARYDESPKLNSGECSSMQFNTVQCRRMQLNTAQYSSMQFQFFGNIKHLKSSAQINAHSSFSWFPSNKWSQRRIWAYKYNGFGGPSN